MDRCGVVVTWTRPTTRSASTWPPRTAACTAARNAGHRLRTGLITSAAEADVLERDIMRHSRHKSVAVMRKYIRGATLFQSNAAAAVGL
jgi:hypothetical protein